MQLQKIRVKYFFLFYYLILFFVQVNAQNTIELKANQQKIEIEKNVWLLIDKDRKLKDEDVIAGKYDSLFTPPPTKGFNFGFNYANFWFRFKLKNTQSTRQSGISTHSNQWFFQNAYSYIDSLVLYHITPRGRVFVGQAGDKIKISEHSYPYSTFSFPILLQDSEEHTFYLKANTLSPATFAFELNSAYQFEQNEFLAQLFYGLFFGSLSIMILYNLFLYTVVQNKSYLYYCGYGLVYMIAQFANMGEGFYHIWGNQIYIANYVLIISIHLGLLFQNLFNFHFLNIKSFSPTVYRISPFIIGFNFFCVAGVFFLPFKPFAVFTTMLIIVNNIFLFSMGLRAYFKGKKKYAKYYVLGWLTFLLGLTLENLQSLGIIPYSFLIQHSHQIGAVIEILFFSFALADQINYYRAENETAQKEKLKIQEELNQGLEQKVKERTNEINEKNEELKQAIEELNATIDVVKSQKEEIEEKQAELQSQSEELRATNDKLIELDRFKEIMTGMIVHDLKNPLNTILGLSDTPAITQAGKQMLNLVMNILDVQKFENTNFNPQLTHQSIRKIIQNALEEVQFLVDRKSLQVNIVCETELVVKVDFEMMVRVLVNLLTNAIKFTPNNGFIELKVEKRELEVLIQVKDKGKGIPADKLPTIFERYAQIEAQKSGFTGSTGLGLSFCKLAIEAHQGKIWVESEIGKGTTFYFTLQKSDEISHYVDLNLTESIQNQDTQQLKFNLIAQLSSEEKEDFKKQLSQLSQLSVFEYSDVKMILDELRKKNNAFENWATQMENALRACNEEKYQDLIKEDFGETKKTKD